MHARGWLGDLPETPRACARKAVVLIAAGVLLAALAALLPRDIGSGASDVPTARVLFVALLTTATSLGLHGLSYAIGGVTLSRRLRAERPSRPATTFTPGPTEEAAAVSPDAPFEHPSRP